MKCITIDDEKNALKVINNYVDKISFLELAADFQDPIKAIEFYQDNPVDLIFLDINMPDLSGLQFLKTLQNEPMVIFTTAYSEFALDSFDFNVIDYLLKPIEFDRFLRAVNKAYKQFQLINKLNFNKLNDVKENNFVFLKSSGKTYKVLINDILYIESMGNYVTFFTKSGKIVTYHSMNQVLEILPVNDFIRIHKSYIISKKHIDNYEKHQVKIAGQNIPIGSTFRQKFLNDINTKK